MTEQQEQNLLKTILQHAKDNAQKEKFGKVTLYAYSEDTLRDLAMDIFEEMSRQKWYN